MLYHAKNCNIKMKDTSIDYISFGNGDKNLIIIPGLGDSLKTVKGAALSFAWLYRVFAKDHKVYVFSRKNHMDEGYSTRDMATDLAIVMKRLGISKGSVIGISQGGMIAQYLAIDFGEMVEKLVLAVTICKQSETSERVISNWIRLAEAGDFKSIVIDMVEKVYTQKRVRLQRPFNFIIYKFMKPKSLNNFIIQAKACIAHDSSAFIQNIQCPVLVIGGEEDNVVGAEASHEIARLINGSKLKIYHGYGHSTYEEAKDFNQQVIRFLGSNKGCR